MTTSESKMFNMVSQNSHWLAGYAYGFTYLHFFGLNWWALIPLLLWLGLTGWKEFVYDYKYETPTIRGSSLEDFIFYQVGWVGALLVYKIF